MKPIIKINPFYKVLILLIFLFVLRHAFFYNNILLFDEEGYRLISYSSIADGEVLYKDVSFHHGIISPYFYGFIFKIFGQELSYVRIASLLITLISIITIFWLGTKLLPEKWAAFISFLCFGAYFMPFYDYGYPVSNCMGYISVLFIILFIYNKKNIYFFLGIFFCSLSFLHNPFQEGFSFGTSIFASLLVYWWYDKKIKSNYKYLLSFPVSVAALYVIFNLYFFITLNFNFKDYIPFGSGQFPTPFKNIGIFQLLNTFSEIIPERLSISSLYFFSKQFLYLILTFILPFVSFLLGGWYFLKNKNILGKKGFIILFFTFLSITSPVRAYFYGSTGRADVFGIAPSVFLSLYFLYLFLQSTKVRLPKYERIIRYAVISFVVVIYIFIQIPGLNPTYAKIELNIKGVRGIKVGNEEAKMINELTEFIFNSTTQNDKLMDMASGGFFAYLTGRELLFKNNMLLIYPLTHEIEDLIITEKAIINIKRNVIEKIKTEKPKIIIIPQSDWHKYNDDFPELIRILSDKYEYVKMFGEFSQEERNKSLNYHKFFAIRVYLLKTEVD